MKVEFLDGRLQHLERDATFDIGLPLAVVVKFRMRMQQIRAAVDERPFRSLKSLHFEKLKGSRAHQYSIRLNRQYRLVLELKGAVPDKVVVIVGIEDYH